MSGDADKDSRMMTRRKFGLGLAFASVAGVAAARLPNKNLDYLGKQKLEDVIPEEIGPEMPGLVERHRSPCGRSGGSLELERSYHVPRLSR